MTISEDIGFQALGDVAEVVMGQSPKGEACNRSGIGIPLLNGPTEFGVINPLPAQWTTTAPRLALVGDTLFCVRGSTTGRMNIADQPYAVGRGVAAVRGRSARDTAFIRYALIDGLDDMLSKTTGTVFPNISGPDLREFIIPWPTAEVRHRVVDVVGTLEDRINSRRKVAELAANLARAIAHESEKTCTVADLVTLYRGGFEPQRNPEFVVDHFSLPAFDNGGGPERIRAGNIGSNKLVVRQPSVLVSRLNPGTNRTWLAIPSNDVERSVCSTEYAVLEPNGVSVGLLWAVVSDDDIAECLVVATTGTTASHQRVREEEVLGTTVPDPRGLNDSMRDEVEALTHTMTRVSEEVRSLSTALDFMLPRLLSGELRVSLARELFEAVS